LVIPADCQTLTVVITSQFPFPSPEPGVQAEARAPWGKLPRAVRPNAVPLAYEQAVEAFDVGQSQPVPIAKVNIVAKKYDETLEFYQLLGVNIPEVKGEPSETRHAPAVDHGNSSFALDNPALAEIYNAEWRWPAPKNSVLLTAQLPTRDAVDSTYAALTGAGHEGVQVPYDAFWGARYAVVRDPEGNSVGLESPVDEGKRSWPPERSPGP
jgi:uncharacterized glyoxalase superfamily protein PhnB